MRASFLAGLLAITTSVAAQSSYYNISSAPFYLVISSDNATLNGQYFAACHEGAAVEGLCVSGPSTGNQVQFTYNTSVYTTIPQSGLLVWDLIGVNDGTLNISSSMQLAYSTSSNVAIPLFEPGNEDYTAVVFADDGRLGIPSSQDDTQPLPNYNQITLYRWYVCTTYFGYLYQTLAWTLGNASPENPTCQKVEVYRKFV